MFTESNTLHSRFYLRIKAWMGPQKLGILVAGMFVLISLTSGCQQTKSGLTGVVTLESEAVAKGKIQFIDISSNMVFESEINEGVYRINDQIVDGDYLVKIEVEGGSPAKYEQQETLSSTETKRDIKVDTSKEE